MKEDGIDSIEKCFWPRRKYLYSIGRKKYTPEAVAAVSVNETDDFAVVVM